MKNSFEFIGNLTKEVELKIAGETSISETSIAVSRDYKNKQTGEYDTDFFRIKAFGKTAEFMANYLGKGRQVFVEGSIRNANYEKDGKTVFNNEYVVNNINPLGKKPEEPAKQKENF